MGTWNLNVTGLGTHSPQVPDEQKGPGWAEHEARALIDSLKRAGHAIDEAFLTHWPGQSAEVRENLLTGEKVAAADTATAPAAFEATAGEHYEPAAGSPVGEQVAPNTFAEAPPAVEPVAEGTEVAAAPAPSAPAAPTEG
jgi:hypothetical protein